MPRRRYTVLIADRSSGVLRRVTISLRTAVAVVTTVLMMPVLIGLGAKWSARDEIGQLQATSAALLFENGNFRQTTGELTTQIQSLENVIDDLGTRASIDPAQARAIQHLPAIVKSRAAGGGTQPNAAISDVLSTSLTSPEDTFGVLRTLLQSLENRNHSTQLLVQRDTLGSGPGRLAADVHDRGALVEHPPRVRDGDLGPHEAAAVGEAVGRDVEDAHDLWLVEPDRPCAKLERSVDALQIFELFARRIGQVRERGAQFGQRITSPCCHLAAVARDQRKPAGIDQPASQPQRLALFALR